MQGINNAGSGEVSIVKVYVKNRTCSSEDNSYGYAIDVQCYDVFLTDSIKRQIEEISALVLGYGPELLIYKHIKEKEPILEFRASQLFSGTYRINTINVFEDYMKEAENYQMHITSVSKELIERIVYLFSAYSIRS